MLTITTDTDGFMDIKCDGADGCGREYNGVGPLWGADIVKVHADSHGPANGNDGQRQRARLGRIEFNRREREAADKARRAAAEAAFWEARR